AFDGTFAGWRAAAREALARGCAPVETLWRSASDSQSELRLGEAATGNGEARTPPASTAARPVPRAFLELAEEAARHRDDERWPLLYRALWRLTHGEPHLLELTLDPDVQTLREMAKAVHRDMHRMRAFVRFRQVATENGEWFIAWFEPEHHIVEANAPFFRDRFASMHWSILTPERCVHWDGAELTFAPGVPQSTAPADERMEDLWRTYYASIFNPARVSPGTLATHMPRRYWKNLPEAALIPSLIANAPPRAATMVATSAAATAGLAEFTSHTVPDTRDLDVLRTAAAGCRACPLWRNATCTVFGRGPAGAQVVFVGEQPGDQEDRRGSPFVGPAGQLLDRALSAAGIDRTGVYLTNAVKHFKWEPRGKRRLHQRPSAREVAACRPWLEAELKAIRPKLIVCLGATAAQSVVGRPVRVLSERGTKLPTDFGAPALITVHPSALLRLPDDADPEAELAKFVADLQHAHA
ncbi:MAG TPA: UdgX family uracil-DNA binding protein, partial [Opitutaceae bacterium]|nr:UdgX family uracil-DNA binding protein [Opitutaceae bacterium]